VVLTYSLACLLPAGLFPVLSGGGGMEAQGGERRPGSWDGTTNKKVWILGREEYFNLLDKLIVAV